MPAVSVTLFNPLPHNSLAGEVAALQGAADLRCGETWPQVMRTYGKKEKMEIKQEGKLSVHPKAGGSLFLRSTGNDLLDPGNMLRHDA
jgi:hypothetical protein